MSVARLEHKLEHLERDLRRNGLLRERDPNETRPVGALLEAATDVELDLLARAVAADDAEAQDAALAAIERHVGEAPARRTPRSPLEAALHAERAKRGLTLTEEAFVDALTAAEVAWVSETIGGLPRPSGPCAVVDVLEGEQRERFCVLEDRARRRLARWSRSRSGLTTRLARDARARTLWHGRQQGERLAGQQAAAPLAEHSGDDEKSPTAASTPATVP